jgi:hypothetical protein
MNGAEFIRNCNAFDPDELARYENQHVAWSEDGRQILAHAPTPEGLMMEIKRLELKHFVTDFIELNTKLSLGGSLTETLLPGDQDEC